MGGGEAGRLRVPEIRLAGPEVVPVGLHLCSLCVRRDEAGLDPRDARLGEELLDRQLGALVLTFTEVVVPDASLRVDEVQRRPVVVRERTPYLVAIVDRDRPGDVHLLQRRLDVPVVVLEGELRRVHAEHHEPVAPVALLPGSDVGQRPDPVDARVRAEVDDDDATVELGYLQRG